MGMEWTWSTSLLGDLLRFARRARRIAVGDTVFRGRLDPSWFPARHQISYALLSGQKQAYRSMSSTTRQNIWRWRSVRQNIFWRIYIGAIMVRWLALAIHCPPSKIRCTMPTSSHPHCSVMCISTQATKDFWSRHLEPRDTRPESSARTDHGFMAKGRRSSGLTTFTLDSIFVR